MNVKRIKGDYDTDGNVFYELEFVKNRKTYCMLFTKTACYPFETILLMKGSIDDYEKPILDSLADKGSDFSEVLEEYHFDSEKYEDTVFSGSPFYRELRSCKASRDLFVFVKDKLLAD